MVTRFVLCPLAMDAEKTGSIYTDVGQNFKLRLMETLNWWGNIDSPHVWAFGAGADDAHKSGPTLGELSEKFLHSVREDVHSFANLSEKKYYGTLEEIIWIVNQAKKKFPGEKLQFIFFTQKRHMPRVKLIVRLFFKEVSAGFVETAQVVEIKWRNEFISYIKLLLILLRIAHPRNGVFG